jgi:hypothetical protein
VREHMGIILRLLLQERGGFVQFETMFDPGWARPGWSCISWPCSSWRAKNWSNLPKPRLFSPFT